MTACASTQKLTVSYEAIEVPSEPKPIDPVGDDIKAEPPMPDVPAAGGYGASDVRAKAFGLWAIELRKWGRGLVSAIETREEAQGIIITRQKEERAAALARLSALQSAENIED